MKEFLKLPSFDILQPQLQQHLRWRNLCTD